METQSVPKRIVQGARQRRAWLAVLVFAQMWLFTNGTAVLGREFPVGQAQFYLFFMMWPLIIDHELLSELLKGSVLEYMLKFAMGYLVTVGAYVLVFSVLLKVPPAPIAFSAVGPLMAVQLFFVAPAEELFFRGFVPRLYNPEGKSWRIYAGVSVSNAMWSGSLTLADVATSASFSAFHYAAYGGNAWTAFAVAFALSMVWLAASRVVVSWPFNAGGEKRPMGIALTIGSHWGFNMCAFGVFTGGAIFGS